MICAPHQTIEDRLCHARADQADAFAALEARVARAIEVMEGSGDCSIDELAVAAETLAIYGDVVRASRAEEVIRVLGRMQKAGVAVTAPQVKRRARWTGIFTLEGVVVVLLAGLNVYLIVGLVALLWSRVFY